MRVVMGLVGAVVLLLLAGCDQGKDRDGGGEGTSRPSPPVTTTTTDPPSSSGTPRPLTPVPKIFDEQAMQESVNRVLTESYQLADVGEVRCPADQPVEVGRTFECDVEVDGEPKKVTITVQTDDGKYEVSAPK